MQSQGTLGQVLAYRFVIKWLYHLSDPVFAPFIKAVPLLGQMLGPREQERVKITGRRIQIRDT